MKNNIVIIGAGGHGRVVLDTILKQGAYHVLGFIDDHIPEGTIFNGVKVIGNTKNTEWISAGAEFFIVALGNNTLRKNLYDNFKSLLKPATVVHPSAVIADSVAIGLGCMVLANTVIGSNAVIGENCIINVMSLVDHDSQLADHVHVSQGTIIGSNVKVPTLHITKLGERIFSNTSLS